MRIATHNPPGRDVPGESESDMKDIGKRCYIINKDSIYFGEWGVVKHFDGEYYHVAIANGTATLPVFDRKELKIPKNQKGSQMMK